MQKVTSRVGRGLKFMSLGKRRGNCLPNTSESSGAEGQGQRAVVVDVHGKVLPALPHLLLDGGVCILLVCSGVQAVWFIL